MIVAEQDRVGGAARQAFVGGVDAREQRDAAGLLEREQARALDHVGVAARHDDRRDVEGREPLDAGEDRVRAAVALQRARRQQQRPRAERQRAAPRDRAPALRLARKRRRR